MFLLVLLPPVLLHCFLYCPFVFFGCFHFGEIFFFFIIFFPLSCSSSPCLSPYFSTFTSFFVVFLFVLVRLKTLVVCKKRPQKFRQRPETPTILRERHYENKHAESPPPSKSVFRKRLFFDPLPKHRWPRESEKTQETLGFRGKAAKKNTKKRPSAKLAPKILQKKGTLFREEWRRNKRSKPRSHCKRNICMCIYICIVYNFSTLYSL